MAGNAADPTVGPPVATESARPRWRSSFRWWLPVLLAAGATSAFLVLAPPGLLAKTRMVGYAVCHQIRSHSFFVGGEQLPLCARCTGTFVGALVGLFGQLVVLRRSRSSEFPPAVVITFVVLFIALMGFDGLNSFLTFFPGLPHLYEPRNWLRLMSGTLYGVAMSGIVYPVLGFTLWRAPNPKPAISNLRDLGILVGLGLGVLSLVLPQWEAMLYPMAVLSALGVLVLLTSVNTVLATILARKENTMGSWSDVVPALMAGLTLSIVQIGVIGALRHLITGTLEGIPFLD